MNHEAECDCFFCFDPAKEELKKELSYWRERALKAEEKLEGIRWL